jgi:predicted phage-related endonuclease
MLTPAQIEARRGKLTASRIAPLMTGDRDKIMSLYLEMIGEADPEDLSGVWPVRLGETTEALHLEWYERGGNPLARRGEVVVHPRHEWAAATLDAWDLTRRCPVECKHVGGREPLEVVIDRYQPQMQWQMECTGAVTCALSVIMGANAPVVEYIDRDEAYAAEMVRRGNQFMDCVAARRPPVALDPVAPPCDPTKNVDMTGSNTWAASAADWLNNKTASDLCRDAERFLKSIVPEDAKRCFGHGVSITRDRAGRLSLRAA